jgi:prepilin-type N-terminal cleavage/methylation domain-containing protein
LRRRISSTEHYVDESRTLIELLVAMTLFSLLSAAVFYSLRTGLTSLDRSRTAMTEARRAEGVQIAVERMFAGILSAQAEFVEPGIAQLQSAAFFQGDPQTMRFVSAHSLEEGSRGGPRLIELAIVPRDERDGFRLVVNDSPSLGPRALGMFILGRVPDPILGRPVLAYRPIALSPRTFVLADRLSGARFSYLERRPGLESDLWLPRWPGDVFPAAVRIDLGGERFWTASIPLAPRL